ncbi:MAG: hypothetical protein DI551_06310 [Micavibrio aeruginosavorus]|uniref:Glycosyltransferase 2-like domain-containing protein n=1 Tax=Micavibrio aeruginosavorus TaxID=349221 RepID=A0A2W5N507_9BACT|nr:MAG: hypothetical protein DI551_06310 [Micavibrio aeruginosavorus]
MDCIQHRRTEPHRKKNGMEKVSIGITCFNAAQSISIAVESALAQDWPIKEIIIVDDASTDRSGDELQRIAEINPIIRVHRNINNTGVAGARNVIIDMATGDFLAFFDDDDISEPSRISRQIKAIKDYESLYGTNIDVMCHTARLQKYPDGSQRIEIAMGQKENSIAPHGIDMARSILFNAPISGVKGSMATCSQMARLGIYRRYKFDEIFRRNSDMELSVRFALGGGHFIAIQDPLVVQSMTYGSDKHVSYETQYTTQIYKKHQDFLTAEKRGNFDLLWVEAKFLYLSGKTRGFVVRMASLALSHPIMTAQRILHALPNMENNTVFKKFYRT